MIDLTGIFTLWCFHDVKNSIPNNAYVNTRAPKFFVGYICSNTQEKVWHLYRFNYSVFEPNFSKERVLFVPQNQTEYRIEYTIR